MTFEGLTDPGSEFRVAFLSCCFGPRTGY